MLTRRALQFFIIFPVTLFLLNVVVWYLLWSSAPDASPRLGESANILAVAIAWLIAYAVFMVWALHQSGSVEGTPATRRLLYTSPLIATPLLCVTDTAARFLVGLPVNFGGIVFSIGLWLFTGYLYAVLSAAVVVTLAYISGKRMKVPGHGP